jgi:hypothetical protein
LQNGISEYFFWNEFGVRYNFIAVNYLIYTNEVIGNIMESYPVIPLFSALFALAGFITYFIVQNQNYIENIPSYIQKLKYQESIFCFLHCLPYLIYQRKLRNVFADELQANGIYKFYFAFVHSELDYFKFYKTIPAQEAFSQLKQQIPNITENSSLRDIKM